LTGVIDAGHVGPAYAGVDGRYWGRPRGAGLRGGWRALL